MLALLPWKHPDGGSLDAYHRYVEQLRGAVLHDCSYEGSGLPGPQALSMIGAARMDNFRAAVEHVVVNRISGDIVECGVWRGGACIFARGVLNAMIADLKPKARALVGERRVFVVDSFQGMPPPDTARYPADAGDSYYTVDWLRVAQRAVRDNFVQLGLLEASLVAKGQPLSAVNAAKEIESDRIRGVVFVPGFFEASLVESRLTGVGLSTIAVLRLDADTYGATTQIFEALYDRVSKGGIVIVDDYNSGVACRKAVHDFRNRRGITSPLQSIDWAGSFWIKS